MSARARAYHAEMQRRQRRYIGLSPLEIPRNNARRARFFTLVSVISLSGRCVCVCEIYGVEGEVVVRGSWGVFLLFRWMKGRGRGVRLRE